MRGLFTTRSLPIGGCDGQDRRTVARLENLYEHVDDIDLFPGGMAENPVVGGIVGE